jgi:AcrR family transcriptional regulator
MSSIISEPSTEEAPRRSRRKEARPGELLAAALDLFVEKGFAATKVEEVAQRAGVSKGTLFLYFASKEELFKAVVRENIVGRLREFEEGIRCHEGSSSELMQIAAFSWWEQVGATKAGGLTKLIMSEAGNFPEIAEYYYEEVIQPGHQLIESILRRGIASGEFGDINIQHSTQLIVAQMLHLVNWKHSFGLCFDEPLDPDAYLHTMLHNLNHGLLARPAQA